MMISKDPRNIACPVCSARAGERCQVRKPAGEGLDPVHYQVRGVAEPLHERRREAAARRSFTFGAVPPDALRGAAAGRAVLRTYRPDLLRPAAQEAPCPSPL